MLLVWLLFFLLNFHCQTCLTSLIGCICICSAIMTQIPMSTVDTMSLSRPAKEAHCYTCDQLLSAKMFSSWPHSHLLSERSLPWLQFALVAISLGWQKKMSLDNSCQQCMATWSSSFSIHRHAPLLALWVPTHSTSLLSWAELWHVARMFYYVIWELGGTVFPRSGPCPWLVLVAVHQSQKYCVLTEKDCREWAGRLRNDQLLLTWFSDLLQCLIYIYLFIVILEHTAV